MSAGHGMLLAFDREGTDDEPFALGFECGRIWALCRSDAEEITETVHAENAEMMLRIAEATSRGVRSVELDRCYLEVSFGAAVDVTP